MADQILVGRIGRHGPEARIHGKVTGLAAVQCVAYQLADEQILDPYLTLPICRLSEAIVAHNSPRDAAVESDDCFHTRAQKNRGRLGAGNFRAAVAFQGGTAVVTLFRFSLGHVVRTSWLTGTISIAVFSNPTPAGYRDSSEFSIRFPAQVTSLFDATPAVVTRELELPVWTYDWRFDVTHSAVFDGQPMNALPVRPDSCN